MDNPFPILSKEWLAFGAEQSKLESRAACMPEVDALLAAGWSFELPEIVNGWKGAETEPWQWYWRSPPKGKRKKGRRYLSTTQAFNALNRQNKPC